MSHAIPPRRCLNPKQCNFGPRNPAYYLGVGKAINMAEPNDQPPHYSIRYGFREGSQRDIFVSTNPRRHVTTLAPEEPPRCDGEPSRLSATDAGGAAWRLRSPDCSCTAELKSGKVEIRMESDESSPNEVERRAFYLTECQGDCDDDADCQGDLICHRHEKGDPVPGCSGGEQSDKDFCIRPFAGPRVRPTKRLWRHDVGNGTTFGPDDVLRGAQYKAGPDYFPMSRGPYRMDLDDECYLYVTSDDGVVVWESPVNGSMRRMIVDSFTGRDPDPDVWPAVVEYSSPADHGK